MARPYSMDLRERAVAAVEGGMSRNAAARQFRVAISTVIKWMARYRATGSVAPGQMGGYKPRSIRGEHEAWLLERIKRGDYTLRGLVAELGERGLKVDYRSVWTFVHEQGQSFKKNRAGQRTGSSGRRAKARAVA
jgi:transposase